MSVNMSMCHFQVTDVAALVRACSMLESEVVHTGTLLQIYTPVIIQSNIVAIALLPSKPETGPEPR